MADKFHLESIGEMKHADYLIERILTLDGLPKLQGLGKLKTGKNVQEMQNADLSVDKMKEGCLKTTIAICETGRDYVSTCRNAVILG